MGHLIYLDGSMSPSLWFDFLFGDRIGWGVCMLLFTVQSLEAVKYLVWLCGGKGEKAAREKEGKKENKVAMKVVTTATTLSNFHASHPLYSTSRLEVMELGIHLRQEYFRERERESIEYNRIVKEAIYRRI
jgi:hypothetical protein